MRAKVLTNFFAALREPGRIRGPWLFYGLFAFLLLGSHPLSAREVPVRDFHNSLSALRTGALFYLEDPDANRALAGLRSDVGAGTTWEVHPDRYPTFDFSRSAHWFRFTVDNESGEPSSALIVIDNEFLNTIHLYGIAGEEIVLERVSGWDEPYSRREIPNPKFAFRVQFPGAARTEVYLRVTSGHAWNLPLMIMDEAAYGQWSGNEQLRMGFYFTVFGVLFLINAAFYYAFRDRSLLIYLVYLFSNFALQFSLHGYTFKYLIPDWPQVNEPLNLSLVMCSIVLALLFAQSFLRINLHMPLANRGLNGLIALSCMVPPLMFFVEIGMLEEIIGYTLIPVCILATIYVGYGMYFIKGFGPARFHLLAWTAYIVGTVIFYLQRYGLLADGPLDVNMHEYLALGSVSEMLLFTVGIASRIRLLLSEERDAQEEAGAGERPALRPALRRVSRLSKLDLRQVIRNLQEAMGGRKIYRQELTLADLAREISISEKDLSEFLNDHMHKSFYSYVNEYRIVEARELLVERSDMKVVAIAHEVGFSSLSTFNRAFQKQTGLSPREYRLANRRKNA